MIKASISVRKVKSLETNDFSDKKVLDAGSGERILIGSLDRQYFLEIIEVTANSVLIKPENLIVYSKEENIKDLSNEIPLNIGQTVVLAEAVANGVEKWEIGLVACVDKNAPPPVTPPPIIQPIVPPVIPPPVVKPPLTQPLPQPLNKPLPPPLTPPLKTPLSNPLPNLPPKPISNPPFIPPRPIAKPPEFQPPKPQVNISFPKSNWKETQTIISTLEEKLKSKVVCYYTSPNSSMSEAHADFFIDHLRKFGECEKISLVLVSYGGSILSPLRIAGILRDYCQQLEIIVPSRCASAATMLSLSGDKILMTPSGYLTAIDCSVTHELNPLGADRRPVRVSVDQTKRVLKFLDSEGVVKDEKGFSEGSYRTLFKYLHPLALAEIDRTSSGSEMIAEKLMKMHSSSFENDEKIKKIANHLVTGYPAHGYPIMFDEAREIGLPAEKADKEISNILWDLVKSYNATTLPQVTSLTADFSHVEEFSILIESKDLRSSFLYTLNRRFNPVNKLWQTENDRSRWVNFKPSKFNDKPFDLVELDTVDSETSNIKEEAVDDSK